jgi:hypothetical protein
MPRIAITRALIALAGAMLLVAGGTSTANAVVYPPQQACKYLGSSFGVTCFAWVGDDQWIVDLDENGWTAVVHVQTNYGKDRYCRAQPSADGWGYCKYDHQEGKCVRFMLYEEKGDEKRNHTAWSPWYGTAYGSPC